MPLKNHIRIALGYFLTIGVLGLVLRMFQVVVIPVNYKFLVHTHSHIALLGWVYTAITTLLYYHYIKSKPVTKKYRYIFWFTQITIVGMMFSFPFTGYARYSILFSTLFLVASYWFAFFFLKHIDPEKKRTQSFKLIRVALWYMILSSIGPWALGIIMTTLGSSSSWYRNAIYFFLHFQYNGWFIIALCGLVFIVLEKHHISLSKTSFRNFFLLLNLGVVFTFFLSILWMRPHLTFYILAGIGGLLQLLAFRILFIRLRPSFTALKQQLHPDALRLLTVSGIFLVTKLIAQVVGALPHMAQSISANIDLIISYLHWTFLGVVSVGLLALLKQHKLMHLPRSSYLLYLFGFLLTEFLISYKGVLVWTGGSLSANYHYFLTFASIILVLGIGWFFTAQFSRKSR
jgi:hypothetical protein